MLKKSLTFLTALAMILSLAACGTSTDGGTSVDQPTDPSVETPSGNDDEIIQLSAPHLGYSDEQIEAAQMSDDGLTPYDDYYMAVRETIEDRHPNYQVEYLDWGWAETLDQRQRAALSAGDPPSLVAGETFMPTYARSGILEPLPQDIVDMVNPSFLIYDQNDVPVAVAHKASIFMLFYNKTLMADAGLDPEMEINTWDEWREASRAITESGDGVWGGGIPTFPHYGGSLRATPFFRQMSTDFGGGSEINLTDPNVIETLEFIREMNQFLPPGLGNSADEGPMWDAFEQTQNIGFVVNGSWQASGAVRNNLDWGVAPLPIPAGGELGNCLVGAVYMAVPRDARNKDAAFDLLRAQLDYNNQLIWLEDTVTVPLNDIINDESLYADNITLMTAMEALRDGTYSGLTTFDTNDAQIWDVIHQNVLARTTMTNDPIETIVQDAQRNIQNLLD